MMTDQVGPCQKYGNPAINHSAPQAELCLARKHVQFAAQMMLERIEPDADVKRLSRMLDELDRVIRLED